MHRPITIRMLDSGVYQQWGRVFGFSKDQVFDVPLKREYQDGEMTPRTAIIMLRLGRAVEVRDAVPEV